MYNFVTKQFPNDVVQIMPTLAVVLCRRYMPLSFNDCDDVGDLIIPSCQFATTAAFHRVTTANYHATTR